MFPKPVGKLRPAGEITGRVPAERRNYRQAQNREGNYRQTTGRRGDYRHSTQYIYAWLGGELNVVLCMQAIRKPTGRIQTCGKTTDKRAD